MDRLLQGVDEESGQPFVLFGKVKIQTLPDGFKVVDERDGTSKEFTDRDEALRAAGLSPDEVRKHGLDTPELPIVQVRALISEIEAHGLDRVAAKLGMTREAVVRRAIAAFVLDQG